MKLYNNNAPDTIDTYLLYNLIWQVLDKYHNEKKHIIRDKLKAKLKRCQINAGVFYIIDKIKTPDFEDTLVFKFKRKFGCFTSKTIYIIFFFQIKE